MISRASICLSEDGHEHTFYAREHAIEAIVRQAWLERMVVAVYFEHRHSKTPVSIVLLRAPKPYKP